MSLGGDVAVAGTAPAGGWAVGIARESSTPAGLVDQVVAITHGGLASSATSVRAWTVGDRQVHHIVDPRTGDCVAPYWVLVSATGASCVEANIVTTAAIVWGEQALDKLAGFDQSLRLVRFDGQVFSVQRVAPGAGAMSSTSLWYATRASGIMALVLFTLTMVLGLTTTTRARARRWPGFAQQEMHRRISMIAVVFLGIHVVTSVLDTYVNISWAAVVVPFTSSYGRFWVGVGAVALDLMLAVFVTSLLRARMRPGHVARRPLARLPELAGRPRPHVRHGHRRTRGLGHRARRGVCRRRSAPRWRGGCGWPPARSRRGRHRRRSPACRRSTSR